MSTLLAPQPLSELSRRLFWSAPAPELADLAPEDPLALDYLAQQVGYWLFGALTTRTSRAQYFAVVLYGLDLASEHEAGSLAPTDRERVERFERWERLWALAVLESLNGQLPRGAPNAFRGVLGAKRAWRPGQGPLSLDYQLISRQSELGGLGAYLSALRDSALVIPGTLRPSSYAEQILAAFWGEPGSGVRRGLFDKYARLALAGDDELPRENGGVTLRRLGERSRLTTLREAPRREQQDRLWEALFQRARDDTLAIAELLRTASRRRATDLAPREFLERAVAGDLGPVAPRVREKLTFALHFGTAAEALLDRYNAIYGAVYERGWVAPVDAVVRAACSTRALQTLRRAVRPVLDHPCSADLRALPMHGRRFLGLCESLLGASPADALHQILDYHDGVQQERQRGSGWMRREADHQLVLGVTSYRAYRDEARFPSLKLNVVQSLLRDLGKIA